MYVGIVLAIDIHQPSLQMIIIDIRSASKRASRHDYHVTSRLGVEWVSVCMKLTYEIFGTYPSGVKKDTCYICNYPQSSE